MPAGNELAVAALPPLGDQVKVYGVVPPVTLTVADPVLPPLQFTFVLAEIVAVGDAGFVTIAVDVFIHPLLSVTVTV